MIHYIRNLFKKPERFSDHKIELHRKYGGTFMLFGFDIKANCWLLRRQSDSLIDAMNWGATYGCYCPLLDEFTSCDWCCHNWKGELVSHD